MSSVLAVGAHPDDIELGCGGCLAAHVAAGDHVTMLVVTQGEVGPGQVSDRIREQEDACAVIGVHELVWGALPDCQVSLHELALVRLIERTLESSGADLVYTHSLSDSHQDHRCVAATTTGAARRCSTVLGYESPSSLSFRPTVFGDITQTIDKKVEALLCHASQVAASDNVAPNRVRDAAGHRGHEARVGAAEGFDPVRCVLRI
jgi:LmbE family N-acetylglucosaminyl deacetylase